MSCEIEQKIKAFFNRLLQKVYYILHHMRHVKGQKDVVLQYSRSTRSGICRMWRSKNISQPSCSAKLSRMKKGFSMRPSSRLWGGVKVGLLSREEGWWVCHKGIFLKTLLFKSSIIIIIFSNLITTFYTATSDTIFF